MRSVYVRSLDSFQAVPIRGSENATTSFASADGRSVALVDAGGVLKTIDLSSGTVTTVSDNVSFLAGVSSGDGNRFVFARSGELWQVTPGAAPVRLTTLEAPRDCEHAAPAFLPGGRALLFAAASGDDRWRIDVLDLSSGARQTIADGSYARYVASGHVVFYRGGELFALPFDLARLTPTGPPVNMLDLSLLEGAIPDLDVSLTGTAARDILAPGHDGFRRLSHLVAGRAACRLQGVDRTAGAERRWRRQPHDPRNRGVRLPLVVHPGRPDADHAAQLAGDVVRHVCDAVPWWRRACAHSHDRGV